MYPYNSSTSLSSAYPSTFHDIKHKIQVASCTYSGTRCFFCLWPYRLAVSGGTSCTFKPETWPPCVLWVGIGFIAYDAFQGLGDSLIKVEVCHPTDFPTFKIILVHILWVAIEFEIRMITASFSSLSPRGGVFHLEILNLDNARGRKGKFNQAEHRTRGHDYWQWSIWQ